MAANRRHLVKLRKGAREWNRWRLLNPDVKPELSDADLSGAILKGANLSDADLSNANLRGAVLNSAKLSDADLSNADLRGSILKSASLSRAILKETKLGEVVLKGAELSGLDFSGLNLSGADLSHTNLYLAQVLGTSFRDATLTGACISDWQIGNSTDLEGVKCDYVFRSYNTAKFTDRLPVDPDAIFEPGEFEKWIKVRQGALDTIDITFTEGIDWQAFFSSLEAVRRQHPEAAVRMQSVQEVDGTYVAALRLETRIEGEALDQLRAKIETEMKVFYERQLIEAHAENRVLERSLDMAMEKLAMAPSNINQNFHGPVGNVAATNQGIMQAIQHNYGASVDDISHLLTTLRSQVKAFPAEHKEEAIDVLDDLQGDLAKDQPDNKRIGRRLKRLAAIATTVAAIAGGTATFSGNVTEIMGNIVKLGQVVGVEVVEPSPE